MLKLPIDIHDLLSKRIIENERVEYKEGWNPQDVLHTLCAFANDFHNLGGGYLIIGMREENGRPQMPPLGISADTIDEIQKEILNLGYAAIIPQYHPITTTYEIEGKTILVLWAPGGQSRPYKAKDSLGKDNPGWAFYIRKQSSTVRAKGADEQELWNLAASVPFDDRYRLNTPLTDLQQYLIREFLQDVGSELLRDVPHLSLETLSRQMNIADGPTEMLCPKNVGLLFFTPDPTKYFPATQIDVVYFPNGAGGDSFEEKVFQGPLGRITRDALDFIRRNYIKEKVLKHAGRAQAERVWNFPFAAVEEAVVNAVYHRSYEIREPIEIRIDHDGLTVLSFPGPDSALSLDALQNGKAVSRRYRNRRIGEFLKELDLTEGRSTGIPKILRAMLENGSPAPRFETDDDRTYFSIHIPVRGGFADWEHDRQTTHDENLLSPVVSPVVSPVIALLTALQGGEKNTATLLRELDISNRTRFRNAVLHKALAEQWIEYTIPDKPTSRNQKYRLTELGRHYLSHQLNPKDPP